MVIRVCAGIAKKWRSGSSINGAEKY